MYYEINIALNGRHFFATAPRSITSIPELMAVFTALDKKFTEQEGYSMMVSYYPGIGYGCCGDEMRKACQSNDRYEVAKLFTKQ
ncbi:hypothetical protein [Pedobacter nutrimenti]|uniref:hypothetical protein n=1 Tax=Pedobacter nutrimenti TaxID=1241337 RepID=UPI00292F5205|nr:hypothetical protein [Pedobacter nutrimenti]